MPCPSIAVEADFVVGQEAGFLNEHSDVAGSDCSRTDSVVCFVCQGEGAAVSRDSDDEFLLWAALTQPKAHTCVDVQRELVIGVVIESTVEWAVDAGSVVPGS